MIHRGSPWLTGLSASLAGRFRQIDYVKTDNEGRARLEALPRDRRPPTQCFRRTDYGLDESSREGDRREGDHSISHSILARMAGQSRAWFAIIRANPLLVPSWSIWVPHQTRVRESKT